MKRTFDYSSAIKILRDGITKGYWTLEDLDTPPPGTAENIKDYKRFLATTGYVGSVPEYRNLLRDAAKPQATSEDDFIL